METRVKAVEDFATKKEGYDKLPDEHISGYFYYIRDSNILQPDFFVFWKIMNVLE